MNARLYDPTIGRFLSPDPYVPNAFNSQDFNRYTYALNNPLIYSDPSGEKWWHWLLGGLALLAPSSTLVTVGTTAYGAYLPFSNGMYMMQKFLSPIAIKPTVQTGSDALGLGFDLSVGMPTSTTSYRWHWGGTHYQSYYDNAYSGWEWRSGSEVTLLPGFNYSGTTFKSGELTQTTNLLTFGLPFSSISYENDYEIKELSWIPGVPKGSSDKFRSAAVQLEIMGVGPGFNIFTGDPGYAYTDENGNDVSNVKDGVYINNGTGDPDKYRFGSLYLQLGPFRFGSNSENIRYGIQSTIHGWTGDPNFSKLNRRGRFYWYFGTGTGNTLW